MKKLSKRMIISVLTLVLTLAALGTTTFAWFSLSTTSRVSQISGNVTGGEGLEIKLIHGGHDTGWLSNIGPDTVSEFILAIFQDNTFDAVSTSNGTAFTKMAQLPSGDLSLDANAIVNEDYIQFEIQFRSQSGGDVLLAEIDFGSEATQPFNPDGRDYFQKLDAAARSKAVIQTRAAFGARLSFEQKDEDDDSYFDVYEYGVDANNNILPTVGGVVPARVEGQFDYLVTGRELVLRKGGNVLDEDNIDDIELLPTILITNPTTTFELIEDDGPAGANYYSTSAIVRIWIEGWDPDSYDSIYTLPLTINLTFKKDE